MVGSAYDPFHRAGFRQRDHKSVTASDQVFVAPGPPLRPPGLRSPPQGGHKEDMLSEAERVAHFLVEHTARAHPGRWRLGPRRPPLHTRSTDPAVRTVAERHLRRLRALEARALVGWVEGERRAVLARRVLTPPEIVRLQARGQRCVSMLEDAPDALAFLRHDLRHLERFFEAPHHRAQVGFFRMIETAQDGPAWRAFDRRFDAQWSADRDDVLADMNGAPLFLWGCLKMRLKMAVRRAVPRRGPRPTRGALDAEEHAAYSVALEQLLDLFELRGEVRQAARIIQARGFNGEAAKRFTAFLLAR